jgi:hypothetical protein
MKRYNKLKEKEKHIKEKIVKHEGENELQM